MPLVVYIHIVVYQFILCPYDLLRSNKYPITTETGEQLDF